MKNIHIIKKNYEFQNIIAKKTFVKSNTFIIYFDKKTVNFRYGISVGKKIGNAVKRNKIKKQVRNMIWDFVKSNNLFSRNIIIIVRKNYENFLYDDNKKLLINTISKIR